ncbi:hypothetical protein TSOC_012216 [Tetrabaena socialis]|uniref:Tc1-like transposase DDE domain-containing protein n=1 Tax=Tetrabaena socialis TaxID=47790 RepID=A0A2J7ZNK5_9CHLO|nr:hypothetical protein TSOC_012216 [Tetrabaena socialis]|eukprot:PNH01851.1 hypothetical protein TSOC_012216 [Tetrabaena socialis]
MCTSGIVAWSSVEGAVTKDIFTQFFVEEVVPKLLEYPADRSVVVFDNCAIHSKQALQEICIEMDLQCLFLPPYSPVYNPIEKVFGAVKQWLRSNRAYVCQVPPAAAIAGAFESITGQACMNWVRAIHLYDTA